MASRSRSFRSVISSATVILHLLPCSMLPGYIDFLRKLAQEADVVLEKDLDVVDLIFQHGETINAHAEGEAARFFGVVVDEAVDSRIDHACAEKFDPACPFALRASATARGRAA